MTLPIALQLYTVRGEIAEAGFDVIARHIADMGYAGVETAGFPGTSPAAAGHLFKDLGLTVVAAHSPLPLGAQKNEVLDTMAALDCRRIVSGYLAPEEHYASLDQIRRTADLFNEAGAVARDNGLTLGIHNHWFEFEPVDGRMPYQLLLERLDQDIFFEVDTYWVKTAGVDPVQVLQELGPRAPLLHIKDGPARMDAPMVAVGDGRMEFDRILETAAAEWLIVELDRCATDMLVAVARSYRYLVEKGWGHGSAG